VVLTISSAMSGTIEAARQAGLQMNIPVHIHDTKSNSMTSLQLLAASRARETAPARRK
jgi:fatty acid-binding protein DegV